jgi:hypothetical protein
MRTCLDFVEAIINPIRCSVNVYIPQIYLNGSLDGNNWSKRVSLISFVREDKAIKYLEAYIQNLTEMNCQVGCSGDFEDAKNNICLIDWLYYFCVLMFCSFYFIVVLAVLVWYKRTRPKIYNFANVLTAIERYKKK